MSEHWLEDLFWISQIVLMLIALCAAIAAFYQIRVSKRLEMLKYLESPEIRKSRRIVMREIQEQKDEDWWNDKEKGERWEAAATDVCVNYDILARMIKFDRFGYGRFFQDNWARSIVENHDILDRFLGYRRTRARDAYSEFTTLAEEVRPHAKIAKGVTFQRK
jgi:hypothetical protein